MFEPSIAEVNQAALKKKGLLDRSIPSYLLAAALAGAYVGLGDVLIFAIGAPLFASSSPMTATLMGLSFGIALTLVIFAGSELFTGNNMTFTISSLTGVTTWKDTLRIWSWSYLGNFIGAMVLCLLVVGAGVFSAVTPDHLLIKTAAKKMSLGSWQLFFRGILCNWLVCLSVWTSMRTKNDVAKLILIFWCLFAFITSGYEHSIANMTLLGLALLLPHPETVSVAGWFHNMIPVTIGNIVGGALFLGVAYWFISSNRRPTPVSPGHTAAGEL